MTDKQHISCNDCGHEAAINKVTDKHGWECNNCHTVWEVNSSGKMEKHLFHYIEGATHDVDRGIHHRTTPFRNLLREQMNKLTK